MIREEERFTVSLSMVGSRGLFTTALGYAGLGLLEKAVEGSRGAPGFRATSRRLDLYLPRCCDSLLDPRRCPASSTDSMCSLVGECYVHGVMSGEGLSMGEPQNVVFS